MRGPPRRVLRWGGLGGRRNSHPPPRAAAHPPWLGRGRAAADAGHRRRPRARGGRSGLRPGVLACGEVVAGSPMGHLPPSPPGPAANTSAVREHTARVPTVRGVRGHGGGSCRRAGELAGAHGWGWGSGRQQLPSAMRTVCACGPPAESGRPQASRTTVQWPQRRPYGARGAARRPARAMHLRHPAPAQLEP
jgi:hypothetical protein